MSSTNRSAERSKWDYYVTPHWMVKEFLESYTERYPLPFDAQLLDCCAGGDSKRPMSYPTVLAEAGFTSVTTVDIRNDSGASIVSNYLHLPKFNHFDLIITNPPFDVSVEIVEKAIEEGDIVVMLQRLNWIGSDKRAPFWKSAPLKHVFAHNKRASFTENGQKDSIEYAHFVFEKGYVDEAKFTLIL